MLRYLWRFFALILLFSVGVSAACAVPTTTSEISFRQAEDTLLSQADDVGFAARAPPLVATNVTFAGFAVAEQGNGFNMHVQEIHVAGLEFGVSFDATNSVPAAVQPIVGDRKLQNLMDNIFKGATNPNRTDNGTLADAVRYERATGEKVGGRDHTIKAQETIRGLQNWLDKNSHGLQADREEAITQIQDLLDALES